MRQSNFGWVARYVTGRVIAAVLVVLVLSWLGMGRAHASRVYPTEAAALAGCEAASHQESTVLDRPYGGCYKIDNHDGLPTPNVTYSCLSYIGTTQTNCNNVERIHYTLSPQCPGGWMDMAHPGQCLNPAICRARPPLTSGMSTSGGGSCQAGCAFNGTPKETMKVGNKTYYSLEGYAPTGSECGANPFALPKQDQYCETSGGINFCMKTNGERCASVGSSKQICWKPGETGEKTDGPVLQKKVAGQNEIPPTNVQLPSGDTLTKTAGPATTTDTKNGTTTTTTTTNYTTTNGTNAGSKNGGESGTGDGSGKEDGDGKGTASGGGDCKNPVTSTGDPVLGMVATQAWATRCAVEAGNAAKVTGDIGDCKSAFTVEGDNANAVQLRGQRAQICNEPEWTKTDGTEGGEGDTDNDGDAPGIKGLGISTDLLDTSGMIGASSCPHLGTISFGKFGSFDMDSEPYFCDIIALLRGVILLLGAFIAIKILAGDI